jgi:hypothetical protein
MKTLKLVTFIAVFYVIGITIGTIIFNYIDKIIF